MNEHVNERTTVRLYAGDLRDMQIATDAMAEFALGHYAPSKSQVIRVALAVLAQVAQQDRLTEFLGDKLP